MILTERIRRTTPSSIKNDRHDIDAVVWVLKPNPSSFEYNSVAIRLMSCAGTSSFENLGLVASYERGIIDLPTNSNSTFGDLKDHESRLREQTESENQIQYLFQYFFNTLDTLKEQNKRLLVFLNDTIKQKRYSEINSFINEGDVAKLDISLLKSAMIMTESLSIHKVDTQKLISAFELKRKT